MNNYFKQLSLVIALAFLVSYSSIAQSAKNQKTNSGDLKTYVIEREIPGAGAFTGDHLKEISQKSCGVIKEMHDIQWIHSYVTGNKIYCVYKAKNPELIMDHAKRGGFPANSIAEVTTVISPATATN